MTKENLTAKRIEKLLKRPGRYRDDAVKGLLLVVVNERAASWTLRYEIGGREKWMGLGSAYEFSLKQIRERALEARRKLADKIDPLEERRTERAAKAAAAARQMTFEQCATMYFEQNAERWTNRRHREAFLATLKAYALPVFGARRVGEVDTAAVLRALDPIWATKRQTADRTRARIEAVISWAITRGLRSGDNPARWEHLKTALPNGKRPTKHFAALPYAQLPAFLTELRKREGVAPRALEFAILTAARTNEIIGATWDEIDLEQRVWTVPAARMKGRREHRVPLSEQALQILRSAYREADNPYVFIGTRGGGLAQMTMVSVLHRMGRKDLTVHGFRSTFRDWAAEMTTLSADVIEMALAHQVGNATERSYHRMDLFAPRKLMDAWAAYCVASPASGAKVVVMRGAAL
jgi:integrase